MIVPRNILIYNIHLVNSPANLLFIKDYYSSLDHTGYTYDRGGRYRWDHARTEKMHFPSKLAFPEFQFETEANVDFPTACI